MRSILFLTLLFALPAVRAIAQQSLSARMAEVLQRVDGGHSPTDEEIAGAGTYALPPDAEDVRAALPKLEKGLTNADTPVRTFAMTALAGLEVAPAAKDAPAATVDSQPAAVFPQTTAELLARLIPAIAAELVDEKDANRALAVTLLGGFTPNPPATVYPPLYAYLKRDDAVNATGLGVTRDLLQLGPLSAETSAAIGKYLRRPDQTADSRANLVEAIASSPNQSAELNKVLLGYLASDDESLRARVILSLPGLDLTADQFTEMKSRVQQLSESAGENPQVVTAAKAVAPCWTTVKMMAGCPVYQ